MSINILILAAGPVEFENHDGGYPLCLTEVDGAPLLERVIESTRQVQDSRYVYAFLEKDLEHFHLDQIAQLITPDASIARIPACTQGSACTALLAASGLDGDAELLVISANELVDVNLAEVLVDFRARNLDGGTITFRSVHPRYSYVRLDDQGLVIEAAQQNPISQSATVGVFWFSRTHEFVDAVKGMIRKSASSDGKFYVAPAYNEMVLRQKRIGVFQVDKGKYHPVKTERQLQSIERGNCE
ncbi:hypothetical protein SAMN05216370_0477 [Pseudomonas peli]|jgi:choline kinase|uniref:Nucleotidyl transferase n=1 Tax=Pseudomonas peli TaxID=592361 RepID=A0AB37Z2Y7_9PSED|nr:glycosyltransferase family 2 protein [Pseudomonas peli]NMZ69249.1 hypothetical protein [Pseudomonas peli]SCW33104.1 hypothetical protein SAMN05216370_0477 [Pseudomonas peli]